MRNFCGLLFLCLLPVLAAGEPLVWSPDQERFRDEVAAKFQELEKQKTAAVAGDDGWLFLASELRFVSRGKFWGDDAATVSRASKPEIADPLPAIVDFQTQLAARGIALLLVPVPPKAAIHPEKIIGRSLDEAAPQLRAFYDELQRAGVEVLDLAPIFRAQRGGEHGDAFCKTDTHWSGAGCVLAAKAIAETIRPKLTMPSAPPRQSEWKEISIEGDLGTMLEAHSAKTAAEKIAVRVVDKPPVEPDPQSPLLLLGDSHTLVFHDFLSTRAGLLDQLAVELGFAPDLIGTRGSGATAVRIDLYRRSLKNPDWLAKKKVIVWCFAAREFTEASQGWPKLPVAK